MIIDCAAHILPPTYLKERSKRAGAAFKTQYARYPTANPGLTDLNIRFRIMDKIEGLVQVLTIAGPNVESITEPKDTIELARIANDEMAELVARYPDRFAAAVAALPMNNIDAALKEVDRAINDLRFRGVYTHTPVNDKPLDLPEFIPLYEKMSQYDLPQLRSNVKTAHPSSVGTRQVPFPLVLHYSDQLLS